MDTKKKVVKKTKERQVEKKDVVACINCRKNHKKCDGDGNNPCSFCKKRKINCEENKNRKANGRPKKPREDAIECLNCGSMQEKIAKFCNQCGEV